MTKWRGWGQGGWRHLVQYGDLGSLGCVRWAVRMTQQSARRWCPRTVEPRRACYQAEELFGSSAQNGIRPKLKCLRLVVRLLDEGDGIVGPEHAER